MKGGSLSSNKFPLGYDYFKISTPMIPAIKLHCKNETHPFYSLLPLLMIK